MCVVDKVGKSIASFIELWTVYQLPKSNWTPPAQESTYPIASTLGDSNTKTARPVIYLGITDGGNGNRPIIYTALN